MYINGYLIGNCHHFCDRFSGGHCSCGGCFDRSEVVPYKTPSESVEVQIVPVPGQKGEDGKDGIDGLNGTNGIDGTNGVDGKDGRDGVDGATPEPSDTTNNWVINGVDTGKPFVLEGSEMTPTNENFIKV